MTLENFDPNGVGVDNGNYFGLPITPEEADLVLISAPWDVTVSYGSGTAFAPDAMIEASTQLDLYDLSAPDCWRRGIATAPVDYSLQELSERLRRDAERVIDHLEEGGSQNDDQVVRKIHRVNEGCAEMNNNIRSQAEEWLYKGKLVGLVGGDHSTPYGLLTALAQKHPSFGVLHIDAHCDLRVAYEGFEFSHASIMHNVLRDLPQVERLVEVGVRDFCDQEYERAQSDPRIEMFHDLRLARTAFEGVSWREQCRKIVEKLPAKVYVSFDIDGLSPDNCPHTGTPVPGGLTFREAIYLLEQLAESGRQIIGFDVVEVTPKAEERIDEIVGARILYKLCNLPLKTNPR
jgi:agmatinase